MNLWLRTKLARVIAWDWRSGLTLASMNLRLRTKLTRLIAGPHLFGAFVSLWEALDAYNNADPANRQFPSEELREFIATFTSRFLLRAGSFALVAAIVAFGPAILMYKQSQIISGQSQIISEQSETLRAQAVAAKFEQIRFLESRIDEIAEIMIKVNGLKQGLESRSEMTVSSDSILVQDNARARWSTEGKILKFADFYTDLCDKEYFSTFLERFSRDDCTGTTTRDALRAILIDRTPRKAYFRSLDVFLMYLDTLASQQSLAIGADTDALHKLVTRAIQLCRFDVELGSSLATSALSIQSLQATARKVRSEIDKVQRGGLPGLKLSVADELSSELSRSILSLGASGEKIETMYGAQRAIATAYKEFVANLKDVLTACHERQKNEKQVVEELDPRKDLPKPGIKGQRSIEAAL